MKTLIQIALYVTILASHVLSQQTPVGTTPIVLAVSSVSASLPLYESAIERQCVINTNNYRSYPSGQSMENLIALIEKLENSLMNTTDANLANNINGAEKLARILLRRFRFDGYTNKTANQRKSRDDNLDKINNGFLGFPQESNSYYFPDYVYTQDELCSLFYSLSHNVINANQTQSVHFSAPLFRGKRQAYNYNNNRRQQNANPQPDPLNPHQPVISNFLVNRNTPYSIKEEGIVSFRGSKTEAIAPARVLIGVIAGLTPNIKANTADVIKEVGGRIPNGYSGKVIDPILAVTLADLWGSGTASSNGQISPYIYGITGEWSSTTCTTHYGLSSVPTDKYVEAETNSSGTLAEIRGGIDGYLIGRSLRNLGTTHSSKLRLSTILRSYYSKPRMSKTTSATYCDRASQITNELQNTAQTYHEMNAVVNGLGLSYSGPPTEFSTALRRAQQIESSGYNEYCNRPGGTLDKTAPCETPSDVLFFIDGSSIEKLQVSSDVVNSISGNLINIRSAGGVVNIFFGSQGKNGVNPNVILPSGPGDWSLVAASFNSTDTGCSLCRINDFNTTLPQAVANTGKYFRYLNQTLFNYEWWTPRTNDSAIPAKSAVLIDLSSVTVAPDSGPDRDDYNNFKDQLRYRHRDVRYLSVATNQELFKDILRDESDKETPGTVGSPNLQLGPNLVKKICDNPATFQYNACHDRKSDNVQYVGYITPGYKQNWAMYPEFFLKSFNIRFSFKAEDGDIKVCYDRTFPPERQEEGYCKELKSGEEKIFEISNPCKGRSLWNCDPFYFTVWGKDRTLTTPCLDQRCASLDQIKFTVSHSGVVCGSIVDSLRHSLRECPDPELIYPCICDNSENSQFNGILCKGSVLNDTKYQIVFKEKSSNYTNFVEYFTLKETKVIRLNSISNYIFSYIDIRDNDLLEQIDSKIFDKMVDKIFEIRITNNKNYRNVTKFGDLHNTALFNLSNNAIEELKYETFSLNTSVNEMNISLSNNSIKYINNKIFNIKKKFKNSKLGLIRIDLSNNHLNDKSFDENAFNITQDFRVELNLSSNNMTYLDENVFKKFFEINSENKLIVSDNDFRCDCKSEWIVNNNYQIRGMLCQSYELFIHELDVKDLLKC